MSPYLYAVVLTLNAVDHVKHLLRALGSLQVTTRIIAIDQGSTDGTREWLRSAAGLTDGILFVPNESNVGVASGWNEGIRIAMANHAQAVLVCGHDTCPMPGAIERMVLHAQAGVPFITGTAVPYDTPEAPVKALEPSDTLLAAPDFSCFMLPTRTIEALAISEAKAGAQISPWQLGLFDERFSPGYFEDNDAHVRLHRAGILAARDPHALFRHDCSLTLRSTPAVAQQNAESFKRNAELFRQKWGALPHQLDTPPQARPLNVTDEQWQQMTSGRAVQVLDQAEAAAQAKAVYAAHGVA